MYGILYGIGTGPGDPELMTLKAVRLIKESDIIAIPAATKEECIAFNIAASAIPEIYDKPVLPIIMPMIKDETVLHKYHKQGAQKLMSHLKEGKNIAFLTLGDPCVYSTFLYVQEIVEKNGYSTEFVNGIPSFCAAAAKLNISLAKKEQAITVIPGSYSLKILNTLPGTKIIMKSGRKMSSVKEELSKTKLKIDMVENCGMDTETVYHGVEQIPDLAGYFSLIIAKES